MSITNYAELQTAVLDWVNRPELTAVAPDWIRLAELEFGPLLRNVVARGPLTLDSDAVTLPAVVGELRSIRLDTGSLFNTLNMVTPETLADYRRGGAGVPRWASVVNGVVLLAPEPDTAYNAEMIYFEALVPLSTDSPTNSTLTSAPNLYLFGALAQAETYLEHDERAGMWRGQMLQAVQNLNDARERAELASAPTSIRLPVTFG